MAALIVNYRTAALTIDCLGSLAKLKDEFTNLVVYVGDNQSNDESPAQIQAAITNNGWGDWVKLVKLEKNGGYSYGNNALVRLSLSSDAPPDFFWLLNPDTIVRPGSLRPLIEFIRGRQRVGIVGSRLEDPDGTPQQSAFRFPGILSEFEAAMRLGLLSKFLARFVVAPPLRLEDHSTDWVAGASVLVRGKCSRRWGCWTKAFSSTSKRPISACEHAVSAGFVGIFQTVAWCILSDRARASPATRTPPGDCPSTGLNRGAIFS